MGVLTALLTATYMFRLVFMAFHGERHERRRAWGARMRTGTPARTATARPLHDAPPAMALALIVLAIGSVVAGYVGVPAALGGHNEIEHYLAPSLPRMARPRRRSRPRREAADTPSRAETRPRRRSRPSRRRPERSRLMGISIAVALGGIGIAWYLFMANPKAADSVAESAGPVHDLLLNKYYVDEIYDAAIVEPIVNVSRGGLWKIVDAGNHRRRRERRGLVRLARLGTPAAAADRFGPRLRRLVHAGRRDGAWLLRLANRQT